MEVTVERPRTARQIAERREIIKCSPVRSGFNPVRFIWAAAVLDRTLRRCNKQTLVRPVRAAALDRDQRTRHVRQS